MSVEILPATVDRYDDAEHALTGGGDGADCLCQWWLVTNAEFRATPLDARRDRFRAEFTETPEPGFIGYVDGAPAGWVRVGPRTSHVRLLRNREVVAFSPEPLDDPSVWTVSCFAVRTEHRGEGLMAHLLGAAVEHARHHGARVIEAYPFDPTTARRRSNELYRGVLSVFESAGFTVLARPKPDRAIVALTLRG